MRAAVKPLYGVRGNPSVDPAVLMKLMILVVMENVRSERQLMERMPERLDWMWFRGFDWDDDIPNHSIISKARRRWGAEVFTQMFEQVLQQCIAGLVDGQTLHVDASIIKANADKSTLAPAFRLAAGALYQRLDAQAQEQVPSPAGPDDQSPPPAQQSGLFFQRTVSGLRPSRTATREGRRPGTRIAGGGGAAGTPGPPAPI